MRDMLIDDKAQRLIDRIQKDAAELAKLLPMIITPEICKCGRQIVGSYAYNWKCPECWEQEHREHATGACVKVEATP